MHRVPRDEWIEWCEALRCDRAHVLETADAAGVRRVVVSIDYAPFDDILEVDSREREEVVRRLIDHPTGILVDEVHHRVLIGTSEETVRLFVSDAVRDGSGGRSATAA